jgi:hypothetical protein
MSLEYAGRPPTPTAAPTGHPWHWWLAVALWASSLIPLAGVLVLAPINRHAPEVWEVADPWMSVGAVAYSLVGLLLATRRPNNALGWLFLGIGLLSQAASLSGHWAVYALETHPSSAGGAHALWLQIALGTISLTPSYPLLLFPSGRLADRATRIVAALTAGAMLTLILFLMTTRDLVVPGFADLYNRTPNPYARTAESLGDPGLAVLALGICGILAAVLLLLRFRRAHGVARQQYLWVVLVMALLAVAAIADFVARAFETRWYILTAPAQSLLTALVPVAMGIAILRHRLFDIDHVFNRVLVYGVLTASLGALYVAAILLFQALLQSLAPRGNLAVAISTLMVAALVQPARRRVQRVVDRRFNRARYDANQMIERFSSQLRNQVDLDAIGLELQTVVAQTMQPAHVSLWLRAPSQQDPSSLG